MIPQNFYSSTAHVRNRRRDPKGNVLKYVIPGLKNSVDIPFPDRKLPVCKRCKKIYKTRELCRVRDGHTDIPWNTTYICVTMDESCFKRNGDSELSLVDEDTHQFVARSIPGSPMPCRAQPGTLGGTKAPICMACKDKNYTRHHCREKQGHNGLPWNTVFVMMSALSNTDGFPNEGMGSVIGSKRSCDSISTDGRDTKRLRGAVSSDTTDCSTIASDEPKGTNETFEDDNIFDIHTSRSFLLNVGKDHCVLKWLEIDPMVPRNNIDFGNTETWKSSDHADQMYPHHGGMMMHRMPPSNWHGPQVPSQRFHPMMCTPASNGSFPPPPAVVGNSASFSSDNTSEVDHVSPHTMMRQGNGPNEYPYNNFDPNFGMMNGSMGPGMMNGSMGPGMMNGPMGPGMMNGSMGPGMMNDSMGSGMMNGSGPHGKHPGMYSDDPRNSHGPTGGNFPSQLHKQYYDGCGPHNMHGMGNGQNMMTNRRFNDQQNNRQGPYPSYPPMNMQQNGYQNAGGSDFSRRPGINGPTNGRSMPPVNQAPMTPMNKPQGTMVYPPPHS